TDAAVTLALASREEAERRLGLLARLHGEPAPSVTYLIGAGRAGFRGGFDPAHEGVIAQFSRADGVTMQGIRADSPSAALEVATRFRESVAAKRPLPPIGGADRESLLRLAPLLAPFGSLVPQTRVRIRSTGSANYGRSIPEYPEEWGGGRELPHDRDLRDARSEERR